MSKNNNSSIISVEDLPTTIQRTVQIPFDFYYWQKKSYYLRKLHNKGEEIHKLDILIDDFKNFRLTPEDYKQMMKHKTNTRQEIILMERKIKQCFIEYKNILEKIRVLKIDDEEILTERTKIEELEKKYLKK